MTRTAMLAAALALLAGGPALAAPVAVSVQDKGVKTLCAEEDNVYAVLAAPGVRRFQATARHPAYGRSLGRDTAKADFRHCAISGKADFRYTPRQVTLYQDDRVKVRGITYSGYWRAQDVAVEVAGRRDHGFHLIQLFVKEGRAWHEVLVLHAADGYWRLRPLPLPQFKGAVYGSSFLVGPVEETSRPYVRLKEVRIDPRAMRFTALFDKGGQAQVTVTGVDHEAIRTEVELAPPVETGRPFLAVRSMYVAPENADAAELRWTTPDGQAKVAPVVGFGAVQATAVGFQKSVPSRHNTSAPDLLFSDFQD